MKFIELTEEQVSDFIVNDPKLAYIGFSDEELMHMYEHKAYPLASGSYYIGIGDEEIYCVLRWEYFTDYCISVHPYFASKYHGTGKSAEVYKFLLKHFKEETNVKKVISFVVEPCISAIKAAERYGFRQEGYISKCHKWRGELTGIYIYGLDLYGDE